MQKFTTTALLLPGISPDLSWVARALHADRHIIDDLHPFQRKSRIHRIKTRTATAHQWLTLPIATDDRNKPVNQVRMAPDSRWAAHFLKALEYNYRNSPWYDFYEPEIIEDIEQASSYRMLIDVVLHLLRRQWGYLELPWRAELTSDLTTRAELTSELTSRPKMASEPRPAPGITSELRPGHGITSKLTPSPGHTSTRTVPPNQEGLPALEGIVWQEASSRHFQRPHPLARSVHFPEFTYRQHFGGFVHGCSLFDVLFELGPESWHLFDRIRASRPD